MSALERMIALLGDQTGHVVTVHVGSDAPLSGEVIQVQGSVLELVVPADRGLGAFLFYVPVEAIRALEVRP